ncbi:MAG TPA: PTS fructose transporter subunit IIA [Elusimicrobia bacterium]|jgi:PTS system nitrogen regulatory IIA component|nr:PTS fructose transporter subunit IIA [Elusimicrobiota bacterium]
MKILDFLCREAIVTDLETRGKKEAITELVNLLVKAKKVKDSEEIVKILMEREQLGSTGIGQGVAIPHGKTEIVNEIVAAFGISKKGIEFDALDGEPVYLIFLLLAPVEAAGTHLKALAKISRLLKDKFFRQNLKEAKNPEEVIRIINEEDKY